MFVFALPASADGGALSLVPLGSPSGDVIYWLRQVAISIVTDWMRVAMEY